MRVMLLLLVNYSLITFGMVEEQIQEMADSLSYLAKKQLDLTLIHS